MRRQSVSADGSNSNSLFRQSSTRWVPTSEQARMLKDLYHIHGVRSPNAEQIQKISTRLRQYGKIEGKNVFYWFSNHRARERQKKRLSVDIPPSSSSSSSSDTIITPPGANATCSLPGLHGAGQMRSCECPGSVLLESSYKWYFMSGGGGEPVLESSKGCMMALESPKMYHDTRVQTAKTTRAAMRTLPLFPIHTQAQEKAKQEHQEGKETEEHHGVHPFLAWEPQQPTTTGRIPPAFHPDGRQKDHCCLELALNTYHQAHPRPT